MMDWAMKSKIQMSVKIPRRIAGLPDIQFQLFCYPEFSTERKQLEPRTLDYSHILTNIRMHICRHGYDFCKTEHFLKLCSERPDILSHSTVEDRVCWRQGRAPKCIHSHKMFQFTSSMLHIIHKLVGKSTTENAYKHKETISGIHPANKYHFFVQELPFAAIYQRSLSCSIDWWRLCWLSSPKFPTEWDL